MGLLQTELLQKEKRRRNIKPAKIGSGILFLTVLMAISVFVFPAMAEDRTPIGGVSLNIASSIEVGDVGSGVEVTPTSAGCDVVNVDVLNEPNDEWKHKSKPKLEVMLEAEEGCYFQSGFSKKKISLSGSKGTVTSAKRESDEELRVVITLQALKADDSDYELDIDEAEWSPFDGTATWSDSEDAKHYELRLYRDGKLVNSVLPGKETSYNLSRFIDTAGTYVFKVRGVYNSSREGDWQESDGFEVTAEKAAELSAAAAYEPSGSGPARGTWKNDAGGWWYCGPDGTYVTNNWQQIDGIWYFFDEIGYRKTGWLAWNGKLYFLNENGEMLVSVVTPDGHIVGADGALLQ